MKRTFKDHLERAVEVAFPPRRIVSLCPCLTETLFALGLEERIVGRTAYCVHPAERVAWVPVVGGPKDVDVAVVLELKPDLVIAAKEENRRETIAELAASVPVFVLDVVNWQQGIAAIRTLGELTACDTPAARIANDVATRFAESQRPPGRRVAYLLWKDPYMAAGRNTYINSLLGLCGWHNVCAGAPQRYPEVTVAQLQALAPELVLLSSEPYPFGDDHAAELAARLPRSRVMLVDGQMFGWYGSRMIPAVGYLQHLLAS